MKRLAMFTALGLLLACGDATGPGGALNETNAALEADLCVLGAPATASRSTGDTLSLFGGVTEAGHTDDPGPDSTVVMEGGVGPGNSDPRHGGWTWVRGVPRFQSNNFSDFAQVLVAPGTPGTYAYALRVSFDTVHGWTYCDLDGAGSQGGMTFSADTLGVLTVVP